MARPPKFDVDDAEFTPAGLDEDEWVDLSSTAQRDSIHEWFGSNVPAGQRGGVDEEEAAQQARRERHQQTTTPHDRSLRKFTGCQFIAHVTDNIKFDKNGDMVVAFRVPHQFKHLAIPLTDAFGIPVSIDVQVWTPYRETEAG